MSPERICLFTNSPLVSASQHNANSITIFDTTLLYFHQYNSPAILSIILSPLTVTSRSTNQLPRWPIQTTAFIIKFCSSDDSQKC